MQKDGNLKSVIITGANTGLGYACAKHIAQQKSHWFVILERKANWKSFKKKTNDEIDTINKSIDKLSSSKKK
jgi:NAD(P)-dependent dehydrogenase (short-subunit alcohol dehydrogenase family)